MAGNTYKIIFTLFVGFTFSYIKSNPYDSLSFTVFVVTRLAGTTYPPGCTIGQVNLILGVIKRYCYPQRF